MSKPSGWRKSSFSNGASACVEVSRERRVGEDVIQIRESERPFDAVDTSPANWAAFVAGVKAGEFDYLVPGDVPGELG